MEGKDMLRHLHTVCYAPAVHPMLGQQIVIDSDWTEWAIAVSQTRSSSQLQPISRWQTYISLHREAPHIRHDVLHVMQTYGPEYGSTGAWKLFTRERDYAKTAGWKSGGVVGETLTIYKSTPTCAAADFHGLVRFLAPEEYKVVLTIWKETY